jgi:hypothetical protein
MYGVTIHFSADALLFRAVCSFLDIFFLQNANVCPASGLTSHICVITCPTEALSLVPKPKDRRRTPPLDSRGQMDLIRQLRKPS